MQTQFPNLISFQGKGNVLYQTPFTWGFFAINFLLGVLLIILNASQKRELLLDFGAMYSPLIVSGEYWRLLTAMFLHAGFIHLLFNLIGLVIFGRINERLFGRVKFFGLYVLTGISASSTSYLFNDVGISIGASGAIFGMMGAMISFFVINRRLFGRDGLNTLYGVIILSIINLWFGATIDGVDNWAHIGGLVSGMILVFAFASQSKRALPTVFQFLGTKNLWFIKTYVIVGIWAALFCLTLFAGNKFAPNPYLYISRAETMIDQGRLSEAENELHFAMDIALELRDRQILMEVLKHYSHIEN